MPDNLIEQIKLLREHRDSLLPSEDLHEQINQAYHKKVLDELLHCVQNADGSKKSEDQQIAGLSEFLKTNWERINGTCMSFTAQPESDLTQLLCDIASFLGLQKMESAIHLLMPSVATESISDKYKDLTELELKEVLRTHILGQEGRYLIPVKKLLDVTSKDIGGRFHPYFDHAKHSESNAIISDEECSRLIKHSTATQAVHDTTEHHIQIEKQQTDLRSQLNSLCRTLRFNDAHGGIGRAESAGEGAYPAIIQFQEFFVQLSKESRDKIPQPLLDEINLLINLSSDSSQNSNATGNIQTCIGTRREKISSAMQGHEVLLASIRLDDGSQQALKKQAEAARDNARNELERSLTDSKTYKGKDALGFTPAFLQWLNIRFDVRSMADINILMQCSAANIQAIISSSPRLLMDIAKQLNSVELLIGFIATGYEDEKVKVVLRSSAKNLNYFAHDFVVLLAQLNPERVALVCSALKERLKAIFKVGYDFEMVLRHLEPGQRIEVYNSFKDELKDIIKKGYDFELVLEHLEPGQRIEVYNFFKDDIKDIIKNGVDFGGVLAHIGPEQRREVYNLFKDDLRGIIESSHAHGDDFGIVLEHLEPQQYTEVCNLFKGHLQYLIEDCEDFGRALDRLNSGQRMEVCTFFKDELKGIIQNGHDFGTVLEYFETQQCAEVCNLLKGHLEYIINDGESFGNVLRLLEPGLRIEVYNFFKDRLNGIIKNGVDFGNVLAFLGPEQRKEVFYLFKNHVKDIIKNGPDFEVVLRFLMPEQRAEVYSSCNGHFKDIIKNGQDFAIVLRSLMPEQREFILLSVREQLPSLVKSDAELSAILKLFNAEQGEMIRKELHNNLPSPIIPASSSPNETAEQNDVEMTDSDMSSSNASLPLAAEQGEVAMAGSDVSSGSSSSKASPSRKHNRQVEPLEPSKRRNTFFEGSVATEARASSPPIESNDSPSQNQ